MDLGRRRFSLALGKEVGCSGLSSPVPNRIFKTGSVTIRNSGRQVAALSNAHGDLSVAGAQAVGLSIEAALFTLLFPQGTGMFSGLQFANYMKQRMRQCFSLFTLYCPYLIVMYQLKQAHTLLRHFTVRVLESQHARLLDRNPDTTYQDAFRHCLQWHVPAAVEGSPAYFRESLYDLLCMVDKVGMPSFFLTLTSDEVSDLRWTEIDNLDIFLERFVKGLTWQVSGPAASALRRAVGAVTARLQHGAGVQQGQDLTCV